MCLALNPCLTDDALSVGGGAHLVVLVPHQTAWAGDNESLAGVVALDEAGGIWVGEVVVVAGQLLGCARVAEGLGGKKKKERMKDNREGGSSQFNVALRPQRPKGLFRSSEAA